MDATLRALERADADAESHARLEAERARSGLQPCADCATRAALRAVARKVIEIIQAAPRGSYQEGLISGVQNWAGSDLKGTAAKYGGHYARSRDGLLARIERRLLDAGLPAEVTSAIDRSRHGQRRLVVIVGTCVLDWIDDVDEAAIAAALTKEVL